MNALDPRCGLVESCPALPTSVAPLRQAVVAFAAAAGADELQQDNIALAMSEAVSNSVLHAYSRERAPGTVTVDARLDDGAIVVTVCDEGHGMVPRSDSPGLGLGLQLIARVVQRLEIEDRSPHSGVRLRMTFPLRTH